ncbi:hypothetical protein Q5692_30465 [Microcoleus sp. C2C3]|uniref:hypothetical protein n=1 Tax=unclassified Microcoleus TaxID=2642155 RepID=UPI002FD001A7
MRSHFFQSGSNAGYALNLKQLYAIVKPKDEYKSLPPKVSNQVVKFALTAHYHRVLI